MKDFLLEIGTEPMPARFIAPAMRQLQDKLRAAVETAGLQTEGTTYKTAATLRRLAVIVTALKDGSQARSEKVKGPPLEKLKDASGAWTAGALGFSKKTGVAPEKFQQEGRFAYAEVTTPGEPAAALLAKAIPEILRALEFPKQMEWEPSRFKFGRPIRSIAALLGGDVVPFEVAGTAAGRVVHGLAALDEKPIELKTPADYLPALAKAHVIADVEERRKVLLERLKAVDAGGDIDLDEELVEETVYMTEQPTPVVGEFDARFTELPAALMALVMKKQLKFFPVKAGPDKLAARLVGVRDGLPQGTELVRTGYQRVLAARGNDAVFFFGRDRASTLESKLPGLARVAYQRGLGSMADKAQRVEKLAARLDEQTGSDPKTVSQIARLCYADLVTDVVKEFTELQGVMGGEYARADGLGEGVAKGLAEFYLPTGPKSPVPSTKEGAVVSLAGKLDSLAGHFALGNAPTGSADPFALRRQALGALRIILEKGLPIDLPATLEVALVLQPVEQAPDARAKTLAQLLDFLWTRLQPFFEDKGYKIDEIRSVRQDALADLGRAQKRLAAVHAVRKVADFEPLAAAFKRASNILKQAQFGAANGVDKAMLKDEAELALYDALSALEAQVNTKLDSGAYEDGLRSMVTIKPKLDAFFDKVMVNVEDKSLRHQRLSLLAKLVRLFHRVADLSEIQSPN